jgi:hypothetical protein
MAASDDMATESFKKAYAMLGVARKYLIEEAGIKDPSPAETVGIAVTMLVNTNLSINEALKESAQ